MDQSVPAGQESIDDRLIEDVYHIGGISLGEGTATCQVCRYLFYEGEPVVAYVFRPAGEPTFQLGYTLCDTHDHELPETYTLGVRELVVEGRVGMCADAATQSSWPVLLAPTLRAVSQAATTSARRVPDPDGTTDSEPDIEKPGTHESAATVPIYKTHPRIGSPHHPLAHDLHGGNLR